MARFALQDDKLFYGVYEAESRDHAIFHLLTEGPFGITVLKYDSERKLFSFVDRSVGCSLNEAVINMEISCDKISHLTFRLKGRSSTIYENKILFYDNYRHVIVDLDDVEGYEKAEDEGLELWDKKGDIVVRL